ncbi:hypothetical protein [Geodermatophilus chilensis]|uniref:hypothetical protein n=1 Tax=Geodermatophilus chilensis TaxID=2035835 RepID=UPI0013000201|nr:hypothetical protein [Geodermatophilus chilensis]
MRSDERLVLMPVLAPGSHAHPRAGGCFAEVAATLSTHQWTDHPTSIPPVLGQIARRVNDLSSPQARTDLAPLIPWAVCGPHLSADLTRDTAVITALIESARSELRVDPDLDPVLQQLERQPRPRHIVDRIRWRRAARHLVHMHLRSIASRTEGPTRDSQLRDLLLTAIDSIRALEGLPTLPRPVDAPVITAHPLPVTTHLAAVHPVLGLRVAPLLDLWPDWIREPWNRRLDELCPRDLPDGEDRPQQPAGIRQAVAV